MIITRPHFQTYEINVNYFVVNIVENNLYNLVRKNRSDAILQKPLLKKLGRIKIELKLFKFPKTLEGTSNLQ